MGELCAGKPMADVVSTGARFAFAAILTLAGWAHGDRDLAVVSPLWRRGVFRYDRGRFQGVLPKTGGMSPMAPKTTRFVLVVAAFVAGLASMFAVLFVVTGSHVGAAAIGGPFQLIDQNGRPFTDADLKGRPFLVFFGFTHCPDACPTTLLEFSDVLDKLGGDADKVRFLFITIDPERDNPNALKDYLSAFNSRLVGLTGDLPAVTTVAKAYRVYFKKVRLDGGDYTMDHTAVVYLMNKEGRFVTPFSLKRSAQDAADDLRRYL
jgi:protein SCO1